VKARKKTRRKKATTQAEVARHLLLSASRVAELVAEGVFRTPLRLDDCRRRYIEYQRETAAGRRRGFSRGNSNGNSTPEERAETLRSFMVPLQTLGFPWIQPADAGRETGWVLPIDEFCERYGIGDDILAMIQWGFPTLPPAEGEKRARVSVKHAAWWNLTTRALIRCAGGDWQAERIGAELDRLAQTDGALEARGG
jgi:hypothetical protein